MKTAIVNNNFTLVIYVIVVYNNIKHSWNLLYSLQEFIVFMISIIQ